IQQPLKGHGKEITQIEIRPPTADHMIRWAQQKIPSSLALLSELCDVPEKLLRKLPSTDFDRVIMAFVHLMPTIIKQDWEAGNRPLATPEEELPPQEQYVPPPDQLDPRFPAVDGPVQRLKRSPPPKPEPESELENGAAMM